LVPATLCLLHTAASRAVDVVVHTQLNSTERRSFSPYCEKSGLGVSARFVWQNFAFRLAKNTIVEFRPSGEARR
ncbi:MAG: hypothetical protein WBX15_12130, partial [Thermoanaerobaculia bacterium]